MNKPCVHVPNQPCLCGGVSVCAQRVGAYYPVMLDLRGKKVVFVGGGWETEHKVKGLLEAGALVTLISPLEHDELNHANLTRVQRDYKDGDLFSFVLVVSHTVNKSDNEQVAAEARERGIWINCVDDPQYCDFILPSVYRQSDLVVAVSTSGKSPAVGIRIKQQIAKTFGPEYGVYLFQLGLLRSTVAEAYPDDFEARKAAWYRMVDSSALEQIKQGNIAGAKRILLNALHNPTEPANQATDLVGATGPSPLPPRNVIAEEVRS
jgi:precorrin-2 dehydrogenase / sirohydrochlorin ferrochelatase